MKRSDSIVSTMACLALLGAATAQAEDGRQTLDPLQLQQQFRGLAEASADGYRQRLEITDSNRIRVRRDMENAQQTDFTAQSMEQEQQREQARRRLERRLNSQPEASWEFSDSADANRGASSTLRYGHGYEARFKAGQGSGARKTSGHGGRR